MAAAAISAPITSAITEAIASANDTSVVNGKIDTSKMDAGQKFSVAFWNGAATSLASQTISLAVNGGGKFNWAAVASDAFGNAIGESLAAKNVAAQAQSSGGLKVSQQQADGFFSLAGGKLDPTLSYTPPDYSLTAGEPAQLGTTRGDDTYTVQKGDNGFDAIAHRLGHTGEDAIDYSRKLQAANPGANTYRLHIGDTINLPDDDTVVTHDVLRLDIANRTADEQRAAARAQTEPTTTTAKNGNGDSRVSTNNSANIAESDTGTSATVRAMTGKSSAQLMADAGTYSKAYAWAVSQGDQNAAKTYLDLSATATALSSQAKGREDAALPKLSTALNPNDRDIYLGKYLFTGADGTPWSTGEDRIGKPGAGPDYVSLQVNLYVASGGGAVNLHNGELFGQWSLGRPYPYPSMEPGVSVTFGNILETNTTAAQTSDFLKGGGWQASMFYPVPNIPVLGVGGGVNHSYGGSTSVEYGLSIPPGTGVNPISYGFEIEKEK